MPPQRVHRMVQYSHLSRPVRPGMMLITTRPALHCGQLDRMGGPTRGRWPVSSRGIAGSEIARLEAIDMVLGVRDRIGGVGPGEADFEGGKRQAADDDRFLIRPPDSGVPQACSGLEGFNAKAVVIAGHLVLRGFAWMTGNHGTGADAVKRFTFAEKSSQLSRRFLTARQWLASSSWPGFVPAIHVLLA